jgi:hypothetical protein
MPNIFAYGSNMCSGRIRDYRVHPISSCVAKLTGYDLCFDKRSGDGSGKVNIVPSKNKDSEIWGVIYEISHTDLDKLDEGEKGYYRSEIVVSTKDGSNVKAWDYMAQESFITKGLKPYTWYKRFLVEGAREHDLPEDYIAKLNTAEAVNDTNASRDRGKRALPCS